MGLIEYLPIVIILLTVISSITGFNNAEFFDRYKFNVGAILGNSKQWDRLLSSAFLHGDWMHLLFNMMTLYFFSDVIIYSLGIWSYLIIYFASIVGGGLLSLWVHRREFYYSAIGASGGVVGILFASIALYPTMPINFMFIPIDIPGWIFAIVYMGYTVYGMQTRQGNIGHDAHLGGAAIGLILAIIFAPAMFLHNILYVGIMVIILIITGYFIWKKK
ncbi:MAG: rhomboid family intramembrane serine protease [Dysgonomonas sp.]